MNTTSLDKTIMTTQRMDGRITGTLPFTPGRVDTTQQLTDVEMFEWLKPAVEGFCNVIDERFGQMPQGVILSRQDPPREAARSAMVGAHRRVASAQCESRGIRR